MNIFFKFFIWKINLKLKRLDAEQRVGFLTNELLKNIQDTGHQLVRASDGFGYLPIWMHRCHGEDAIIDIQDDNIKSLFRVKPTFKFKLGDSDA